MKDMSNKDIAVYLPEPGGTSFINISVNGTIYSISEAPSGATWNNENTIAVNSNYYTISNNKVVWNDGTILQYNGTDVLPIDTFIINGEYTTRAATSNYVTWKFNDTMPLSLQGTYSNRINFICNGVSYTSIDTNGKPNGIYYGTTQAYSWTTDTWNDTAYQTIKVDTNSTDYASFVTWAKANGGVLLEKGTYKWVDTPSNLSSLSITPEKPVAGTAGFVIFSFTTNNAEYNAYFIEYLTSTNSIVTYAGPITQGVYDVNNGWTNDAYKTITTTADQYIDYDFYNYAITGGQLVKQEIETTTTLPAGTYKFNNTITGLSSTDTKSQDLRFKISGDTGAEIITVQGTNIQYGKLTEDSTTYTGIAYTVIEESVTATAGVYKDNAWLSTDYQVITITSNQEVTQSFYDWFMANASTYVDNRIRAGTYNFILNPETPDPFSQTFAFKSNNVSFAKMECKNTFGSMYSLFYDTGEVATTTTSVLTFKNPIYRLIEVEETQEVSQDFHDWFVANTTDSSASVVIKKGKYLFNEELTLQDGFVIVFQNFKARFSHVDFTGLVLYNTADAKSGSFTSDTNTTMIRNTDGSWLNPQSRQFELTEDYDIIANSSDSLSTAQAYAIEDWFEGNTTKGIDYYTLKVNNKQCNTWNGKAINKLNDKYIERKYSISGSYTNLDDQSYAKTNTIYSTDSIQLVLSANDGYELDKTKMVVQNASVNFYNLSAKNAIYAYIYNPLGNVSVSLSATPETYTITTTLTNCVGNADNATTIQYGGGAILYYTANTGYELPDGVELTNVGSYNWDKTTGKLVIARPTGNVTIKIEAEQTMTQLATPQNVAVEDTTLSFDEVENAEEYEVFVDNVSIGTYSAIKLITFTIDSITYQAEEEMTWEEWVNSSYNTNEWYIGTSNQSSGSKSVVRDKYQAYVTTNRDNISNWVLPSNIIESTTYYTYTGESSGSGN